MILKTSTGDIYFNRHVISRIHVGSDGSQMTVHFNNGTSYSSPEPEEGAEGQGTNAVTEFIAQLASKESGFIASGKEFLNLKSALWIAIPFEGPVQVRSPDDRTHTLPEQDPEQVKRIMEA